jgi:cation diffusion facilitator family transporter
MVMNLIIPVIQIYGGIISGSMALIIDALHNLNDFISLMINYAALLIGRREPTYTHTFGYKRVEIFATLISVACCTEQVFILLWKPGIDSGRFSQLPDNLLSGLPFWDLPAILFPL